MLNFALRFRTPTGLGHETISCSVDPFKLLLFSTRDTTFYTKVNNVTSRNSAFDYPRTHTRTRHYAGRISENSDPAGTRTQPHRAWHFQRDVERALLLQIVARAPEAAADAQPARGAGPGRKCRHHRHRRWLGLRLQDRVAQSPFVHRAASGRGDRRRRHPARHLHHGRASGGGDGLAALRPDHARTSGEARDEATIHQNHSVLEGVVSGIASYGNCFGVPNLGGETKFEACYSQNPLVNAFALGLVRRDKIFYAKACRRRQSGDLRRLEDRPRRHPRRHHGQRGVQRRIRSRSVPTCRSAIRSWKNCCWKPASKPWRPAPWSAFRTWAPPA